MNIFVRIFIILLAYMMIGSIVYNIIDEKTKYTNEKFPDGSVFIIVFLWPLYIFRLKKLKKIRKIYYYKFRLNHLNTIKEIGFDFLDKLDKGKLESNYTPYNDEMEKERIKIQRALSLRKINRFKLF
jgi:hypothetical protein